MVDFLTGTAGVPPAMSAQREKMWEGDPFCETLAPCGARGGRDARGPSKELESTWE